MTTPATKTHWQITVKVDTALCIGDSGTSDTGVDKATVKTSEGKLYIPASTLKGIWRHACEAIARGRGDFVCDSPRAENMCPQANTKSMKDEHCIICQIFGAPNIASSIYISDLAVDTELVDESTEVRNGVSINRWRRIAEDQRLYFTETSLSKANIAFSGDVTIDAKITPDQLKLLRAGLKYIHAIGSGKTRGLGWVSIQQADHPPETQAGPDITPEPDKDFMELAIEITLKSPMVPGGRKPTGQIVEALQYIRGGLLRGAVADMWLADLGTGEPDDDFKTFFLEDGAATFRNCYPGERVLPATAIGCKDFAGFLKENDDQQHGIFDTLLERLVAEKVGFFYNPTCPHCDDNGRVESQGGFYTKSNGFYERKALSTRLLTRVAINRERKVAADELLYNLNAVDPLTASGEHTVLRGTARVPSSPVGERAADTLQKEVKRLGGGTSRGLGQVCITVKKRDEAESLKQRIEDFNKELQKVWKIYSPLSHVAENVLDGTYFTIALQSEAILEDNWQRSMVFTGPMLQEMTGCGADVRLVRSFASSDYVSGWNAAWKLPKETDLTTRIGSVFVFHTTEIDPWISVLETLEQTGIGERREEGFGQILICDSFHLRTRKQVKSGATWLENKE